MRWRAILIDWPARATEVAAVWYRAYFILMLLIAGPGILLMLTGMLVLWYVFGIRWGW